MCFIMRTAISFLPLLRPAVGRLISCRYMPDICQFASATIWRTVVHEGAGHALDNGALYPADRSQHKISYTVQLLGAPSLCEIALFGSALRCAAGTSRTCAARDNQRFSSASSGSNSGVETNDRKLHRRYLNSDVVLQ